MQAIGRGRGDDRTEANPLQIDILTNVPLPLVVDRALRWKEIQPSLARVMWARGAVPVSHRDMHAAYPDLFTSHRAAETAMQREAAKWAEERNPTQTPIEYNYLIGVCVGYSSVTYRKAGSRGPAGRLLYDPERIDPSAWLAEHLGATVTAEALRPAPRGIPMVEVLVDGKSQRVIDFNSTAGSA
jgi:putative DNA primase/helicase